MSTHAGALLLAAMAYTYARKYSDDPSFTFGAGVRRLGRISSAIGLAVIALLIGYEAVSRFLNPVAISSNDAITIAVLGLAANVARVAAVQRPSSWTQQRSCAWRRRHAHVEDFSCARPNLPSFVKGGSGAVREDASQLPSLCLRHANTGRRGPAISIQLSSSSFVSFCSRQRRIQARTSAGFPSRAVRLLPPLNRHCSLTITTCHRCSGRPSNRRPRISNENQ